MSRTTDWSAVEHAYGAATDIPPLLIAIAKGKASAVETLANKVAHQGWSSPEAAARVVPELLELVDGLKGKTLAAVIVLLADLACGGSHEHFMGTGFDDSPLRGLLEDPHATSIRDQLAKVDTSPWLRNRSAAVRSAAGLFVAFASQDAAAVLDRQAREKNADVLADLLLTLGWHGEGHEVLTARREDSRQTVSAAAAIALAMASTALDEELERGLQAAAAAPPSQCAWAGGDLARLTVELIRHRAHTEMRPQALYGVMDSIEPLQRTKIGAALVQHAFRDALRGFRLGRSKPAEAPPPFESLSQEQLRVLELLTRYNNGWGRSNDQAYWLRQLGLPQTPPAMSAYLGEPISKDHRHTHVLLGNPSGTLEETLISECRKDNFDVVPALARATLQAFAPAELLDMVEDAVEVPVPWPKVRSCWVLHVLTEAGQVAHVRARFEHYCEHGSPSFWTASGRATSNLTLLLWTVLHHLDRAAVAPDSFVMRDRSRRSAFLANLRGYDERSTAWLRAAMQAL